MSYYRSKSISNVSRFRKLSLQKYKICKYFFLGQYGKRKSTAFNFESGGNPHLKYIPLTQKENRRVKQISHFGDLDKPKAVRRLPVRECTPSPAKYNRGQGGGQIDSGRGRQGGRGCYLFEI